MCHLDALNLNQRFCIEVWKQVTERRISARFLFILEEGE